MSRQAFMETRRRSNHRRIGLGTRLVAAGGAVVVALVLCEIGLRLMAPTPPDPTREPQILYQGDPDIGFGHVPDQVGWLDDGLATINAIGLRGALPEIPKPEGSVRVLTVGDSTTFGWGVGDDETYPAQLENLLRREFPAAPLDVVNGGIGAYDLKHEARFLQHFAPRLKPDIVLVGLYWNDLPYERMDPDGEPPAASPVVSTAPNPMDRSPGKPFRIGNQPSRLNRILRRSRVLFTLRHAWLGFIAPTERATNLVQWEMALLEGRRSKAIDYGWEDVAATLRQMAAMGEAGGFAVGVVVIPIRAQVEGSYPNARYQSEVRAMAEAIGLFVVDPLPLMVQPAERERLFIPYDRMHLSGTGNYLVAEAAFQALRKRPEFRELPVPFVGGSDEQVRRDGQS